MAHLIYKDALVAEIEKLMYFANLEADIASTGECFDEKVAEAKYQLCKRIISIINTLEVKEADFGMEVYKYIGEHFKVYDDGNQTLQNKDKNTLIGRVDAENIAKHFFELGLKQR